MVLKEPIAAEEEIHEGHLGAHPWPTVSDIYVQGAHWTCDLDVVPRGVHVVPERGTEQFEWLSGYGRLQVFAIKDTANPAGQRPGIRVLLRRPQLSLAEQACSLFVRRMRPIGIVREVRCTEDEDRITAWTITEGPVFDFDSNRPIYEAAIEVMRLTEESVFDFRIINVNELDEGGSIEDILPTEAKAIWTRHSA